MEEKGLTVADALALSRDNDSSLGGNGAWWIIIFALLFGWGGRGGFGYGNGGDGTNTVVIPSGGFGMGYAPATAQGMADAFNFNALDNGIRANHDAIVSGFYQNNLATTNLGTAMQMGLASSDKANLTGFASLGNQYCNGTNTITNAMNNGFNNIQAAICDSNYQRQQCCCNTQKAIMQSDFNNLTGFNNVVNSLATNACDIERGQDDIKYLMAQNQNSTIVSIDKLGDRIIDYMNQKEMDTLRTELQNAKFQISQAAQTEQLLNQLQPISRPAYITASPYQSLNYNGVNGCGCGNF